jgi:hypothetical protein
MIETKTLQDSRKKDLSSASSDRDLRIDFLRGVVMFILIIVHVEFFSLYNLVAWERIGLISGGEGFCYTFWFCNWDGI